MFRVQRELSMFFVKKVIFYKRKGVYDKKHDTIEEQAKALE